MYTGSKNRTFSECPFMIIVKMYVYFYICQAKKYSHWMKTSLGAIWMQIYPLKSILYSKKLT